MAWKLMVSGERYDAAAARAGRRAALTDGFAARPALAARVTPRNPIVPTRADA